MGEKAFEQNRMSSTAIEKMRDSKMTGIDEQLALNRIDMLHHVFVSACASCDDEGRVRECVASETLGNSFQQRAPHECMYLLRNSTAAFRLATGYEQRKSRTARLKDAMGLHSHNPFGFSPVSEIIFGMRNYAEKETQ